MDKEKDTAGRGQLRDTHAGGTGKCVPENMVTIWLHVLSGYSLTYIIIYLLNASLTNVT